MNNKAERLSVVVPAFNEAEVLPEFHRRLGEALDKLEYTAEIIYINDGSSDSTLSIIERLAADDPRVALVDLSRNFGKEVALTAGLDHSQGDAAIIIDADLQDPPELIPELVRVWKQGFDVVYAQRTGRAGETWLKKYTATQFYRVMGQVGRVPIPAETGDFRLLSRRAINAVRQLREHNRFMKGLFSWIGYPQKGVPYQRDSRHAGITKWNYWKLWNFALDGITAFTTIPLKFATYIGTLTAMFAFIYGLTIIVKTLYFGIDVPGYASLMVVVLFIGGIQLTALGIIGEYLGRTFEEVKNRPLYFVLRYSPAAMDDPARISTGTD
jgi:glycosyltransferase involved in cell wall biosynthesis